MSLGSGGLLISSPSSLRPQPLCIIKQNAPGKRVCRRSNRTSSFRPSISMFAAPVLKGPPSLHLTEQQLFNELERPATSGTIETTNSSFRTSNPSPGPQQLVVRKTRATTTQALGGSREEDRPKSSSKRNLFSKMLAPLHNRAKPDTACHGPGGAMNDVTDRKDSLDTAVTCVNSCSMSSSASLGTTFTPLSVTFNSPPCFDHQERGATPPPISSGRAEPSLLHLSARCIPQFDSVAAQTENRHTFLMAVEFEGIINKGQTINDGIETATFEELKGGLDIVFIIDNSQVSSLRLLPTALT
ncbi:hypothetical protein GQ43DRAFT_476003 [Delitschia confertaspora ATCC 74209]|uniref:Uncharacterized protein n=1 Tax=Delitschia confertaspora ATCC 74209 TaxID=1513339 RepID=A0A9P4JF87_9PLEO|nr:hypothetical protein GQ43DRAFT_476003 [Delitschia confertaspora ATCC 74209]